MRWVPVVLLTAAACLLLWPLGAQTECAPRASRDIRLRLKDWGDADGNLLLSTREIRSLLRTILHGIVTGLPEADVNGDCIVNRRDTAAAVAAFRTLIPDTCGDGVVHGNEECDDGNRVEHDGCTRTCTLPVCGDGIVQGAEECDDSGRTAYPDECRSDCTLNRCPLTKFALHDVPGACPDGLYQGMDLACGKGPWMTYTDWECRSEEALRDLAADLCARRYCVP